MPRVARVCLAALLVAAVAGCAPERAPRTLTFQGRTMGTTYTVRVVSPAPGLDIASERSLAAGIGSELERMDALMSHYKPDSELSRFNGFRAGTPFPVSRATLDVLVAARELSVLSGGAFDVTAAPLVNAWGFGPAPRRSTVPSKRELAGLLERIGYDKLVLDASALTIQKRQPGVTLDLSAIAKGYGVDRVAEHLRAAGIEHYMIEVGGEVRTGGRSAAGQAWHIAIEKPTRGKRAAHTVVGLSGQALATSGDYRNYRNVEGQRVTHTIDPRTGRPVSHRLASVSVVASRCMWADGLATALNVLGPTEGWALAVELDAAALFLVADGKGGFEARATPAFEPLALAP